MLSAALFLPILLGITFFAKSAHGQTIQVARQTNSERAASRSNNLQATATQPADCPTAYYRSLQTIGATAGERLQSTADRARRGTAMLPRYWLFWQPGRTAIQRKLARIGARSSVIVVEDRICTRSVLGGGGRIRCLKWEPKPKNFKPPPPPAAATTVPNKVGEPAATPNALKRLKALAGFVRSSGAVDDLRRRGRLHQLTKRVGSELLGYLGQEMRPTICTGGLAMVDFYARQLAPLTARVEAAARGARQARAFARRQVAAALEAWQINPGQGGAQPVSSADEPARQAGNEAPEPDLSKVPAILGEMVLATAKVMLPRELVGHIKAEDDEFARLIRAREAMSADAASEAPPHVHAVVFRAFRAIEIAYYADLSRRMFDDYGAALNSLLKSIAESHQTNCTCE